MVHFIPQHDENIGPEIEFLGVDLEQHLRGDDQPDAPGEVRAVPATHGRGTTDPVGPGYASSSFTREFHRLELKALPPRPMGP